MFASDTENLKAQIRDALAAKGDVSNLDAIVEEASRTHGVDPHLIRSVMHVESSGNAKAVSPKGARGLMQLMPATAKELGVTNIDDPRENVLAGAKYLRQLSDRFGGDEAKVLSAYNFGPSAVAQGRPLPRETQRYVQKVSDRRRESLAREIMENIQKGTPTEETFAAKVNPPKETTFTEDAMAASEKLGELLGTPKRGLDMLAQNYGRVTGSGARDAGEALLGLVGYTPEAKAGLEKLGQTSPTAALVDETLKAGGNLAADPMMVLTPGSRLIASAFVPSALKHTITDWESYGAEMVKQGWSPESARALVRAMMSSEFLAMAGHGAKGEKKLPAQDAHVRTWEKFTKEKVPGPSIEEQAKQQGVEDQRASEERTAAALQEKILLAQAKEKAAQEKERARLEKAVVKAFESKKPKSMEKLEAEGEHLKLQLSTIADALENEPVLDKGGLGRAEGFNGPGTGDVVARWGQMGSAVKAQYNLDKIKADPKRLAKIIRRADPKNPIYQEVVSSVKAQMEDYADQAHKTALKEAETRAYEERLAAEDAETSFDFGENAPKPKGPTMLGEVFPGANKVAAKIEEMLRDDVERFRGRRGGLGTRPSLEPEQKETEGAPLPEYKAPPAALPEGMKAVPDMKAGSKEAQAALEETNAERAAMGMPPNQPLSAMRPFEAPRTKYENQVNEYAAKARAQGLTSYTDVLAMVNEARGRHGSRSGKMAQDILDYMKKSSGGSTLLGEVFPGAKAASDWIQGGLDELVRGTRMNRIGLYSKMDEVLDRIPQKMTAPELEKWLLKQGVKKEELRARDFDKLAQLDAQYGKGGPTKRTPEEWRAQLVGSGEHEAGFGKAPEVREITYGERSPEMQAELDGIVDRLGEIRAKLGQSSISNLEFDSPAYNERKSLVAEANALEDKMYTLGHTTAPRYAREGLVSPGAKEGTHRERLLQVGESGLGDFAPKGPAIPHFSNERGVVGWSRTAEHEGPQGTRDLHVNEIQSDIANALKQGSRIMDESSQKMMEEMPFVGDMSWVDLTAKNILWHAAQGDYDRVTWTGAEEQANRNAGRAHADVYEKLLPGAMKRLTGERAEWEPNAEAPPSPSISDRARADQLYDDLVRIEKARTQIWDAADLRKRQATGARDAMADEGDLTPEELKLFTEMQEDHAALAEEHDAIARRLRQFDKPDKPVGKWVIRLTPELKASIKKQGFPLFSELFPGAKKLADGLSKMVEDDLAAAKEGRLTPVAAQDRQEKLVKAASTVQFLHAGLGMPPGLVDAVKPLVNRGTVQAALSARSLTALNNLWNTGVRYSLATLFDAAAAPISGEARSALSGKGKALPDLWGNLWDSVVAIGGKERPGARTFDQATLLKELTQALLPGELHNNFWHLLSNEIEMPGGGSRPINPSEKAVRLLTAPNVIGERSSRLYIARAELQPIMDKLGVNTLEELQSKVIGDPSLLPEARVALNNAVTFALDMTAALPPMPGLLRDFTRLVNRSGIIGALTIPEIGPFPRLMLHNLPQQIAEHNLPLAPLSQRWRNSAWKHGQETQKLAKLDTELEAAEQALAAAPNDKALQLARGEAAKAFHAQKSVVREMEAVGVKSKRQLAELAFMGPAATAIFAVKALMETENKEEWFQFGKGKGWMKDLRGMVGSLAPNALLGHWLGKLIKSSPMYTGKVGYANFADAYEAVTGTRKGPKISDIPEQLSKEGSKVSKIWEVLNALSFRWGQALTSPWMVEVGKKGRELRDPEELKERTYSAVGGKDIPGRLKTVGMAFSQGVRSNLPGLSQALPEARSSLTGKVRARPDAFSEYGPLPGRVNPKSNVEEFITRHKGKVREELFAVKQSHYPEYDKAVGEAFSRLQEKDPLLRLALSSTDRSDDAQVNMVEHRLSQLRQMAVAEARKGLLARIRKGEKVALPEDVLQTAREAGEKQMMQRQAPAFYRHRRVPAKYRMKKLEERQLQKLGKEDMEDVE